MERRNDRARVGKSTERYYGSVHVKEEAAMESWWVMVILGRVARYQDMFFPEGRFQIKQPRVFRMSDGPP